MQLLDAWFRGLPSGFLWPGKNEALHESHKSGAASILQANHELGLPDSPGGTKWIRGVIVMARFLLLLPLLIVPPMLVTGYFLYLAVPVHDEVNENTAGPVGSLLAARRALVRGNAHVGQALIDQDQGNDPVQQAIVEFRFCLAYESAAPVGGELFDEARHNLEACRLLLAQRQRPVTVVQPAEIAVAPETADSVAAKPVARALAKVGPLPLQLTATSRERAAESSLSAAAKPIPSIPAAQVIAAPVKPNAVGPDGISYEAVEGNK
jgi:hypothetical protein